MALPTQKSTKKVETLRIQLTDNQETTVHIVQYDRRVTRPRVVLFDEPTRLLDWCKANNVADAINGGFFGNEVNGAENGKPVGEVWTDGQQVSKTMSRFDRGCLHIDEHGRVTVGYRSAFPQNIVGDLLEVGPLLLKNAALVFESDVEGFSAEANFFDNDVTIGRAQRVAVAHDEDSVWFVVSEGRSPTEAGLTLKEMAEFLLTLGATHALNLDGGSGSSLVLDQKLINKPRMGADRDYQEFPCGREIVTALVFDNNGA